MQQAYKSGTLVLTLPAGQAMCPPFEGHLAIESMASW